MLGKLTIGVLGSREIDNLVFGKLWIVFGVREIDRGVVILVGRVRWGCLERMTCGCSKFACHMLSPPWLVGS